jgi:hypothetical protein
MGDTRNKPGWSFWLTVTVVGVPALYVLSFGPACWINHATRPSRFKSDGGIGSQAIVVFYRPIVRLAGPQFGHPGFHRTRCNSLIVWYARLGIIDDEWPSTGASGLQWTLFRGNRTW